MTTVTLTYFNTVAIIDLWCIILLPIFDNFLYIDNYGCNMPGIVIREYDFCYYLEFSNFATVTIKNYFNTLPKRGKEMIEYKIMLGKFSNEQDRNQP